MAEDPSPRGTSTLRNVDSANLLVVFISQLGTGGDSWRSVIDHMRCGSPTFTYDRPGTGGCPPRQAPNPPLPYSAFAAELEVLLGRNGVTGPLVVVGHSVGSLIARVFVGRNVDRVAGIVHIDGSIPRLSMFPAVHRDTPPDGDGPRSTFFDALAGEVEVLDAVVPAVPAAVIARCPGWRPADYPADAAGPLWFAYQRQVARLHGVPLMIAEGAGHQIPAEAPALVARAIDSVVTHSLT